MARPGLCAWGFSSVPTSTSPFTTSGRKPRPPAAAGRSESDLESCFSAMIALTLVYAATDDLGFPRLAGETRRTVEWFVWAVMGHMVLQLGFTIVVHLSRLSRLKSLRDKRLLFAMIVGAVLSLAVPQVLGSNTILQMTSTEFIYRAFMGCYGLFAPAYVLICVVPNRVSRETSRRVWLVVVLVASPTYALGFLAERTWVLGPGLAVVLTGTLLVQLLPRLIPARALPDKAA